MEAKRKQRASSKGAVTADYTKSALDDIDSQNGKPPDAFDAVSTESESVSGGDDGLFGCGESAFLSIVMSHDVQSLVQHTEETAPVISDPTFCDTEISSSTKHPEIPTQSQNVAQCDIVQYKSNVVDNGGMKQDCNISQQEIQTATSTRTHELPTKHEQRTKVSIDRNGLSVSEKTVEFDDVQEKASHGTLRNSLSAWEPHSFYPVNNQEFYPLEKGPNSNLQQHCTPTSTELTYSKQHSANEGNPEQLPATSRRSCPCTYPNIERGVIYSCSVIPSHTADTKYNLPVDDYPQVANQYSTFTEPETDIQKSGVFEENTVPKPLRSSEFAEVPYPVEPNPPPQLESQNDESDSYHIASSTLTPKPSVLQRFKSRANTVPSSPPQMEIGTYSRLYSSFVNILSISYKIDGSQGPNIAATSETIVAVMRFQQKLFGQWYEVMLDYATVFCKDPTLRLEEEMDRLTLINGLHQTNATRQYRVNTARNEVFNIVHDVMKSYLTGWGELPSGLGMGTSWNLLWTWGAPRVDHRQLLVWQKVNHFKDSKQLTRKDLLKRHLQRLVKYSGKSRNSDDFAIMPLTFLLPNEYVQFVSAFSEASRATLETGSGPNLWILKPVGLSRGRGISVISDLSELKYSQQVVLQQYVSNPLLLGGYKFDLRLYVLVTSFRPLEAFIHKEGFARVSTHKYSTNTEELSNRFIHLTNSSVQANNTDKIAYDNPLHTTNPLESAGTKISLSATWELLQAEGVDTRTLWKDIHMVVLKSLMCVDDKMTHQPSAFELFGFDVLIDANLRPWLLEVNSSPSMARDTALDMRIKNAVIRDTIALVDPPPFDRLALKRIIDRRLPTMMRLNGLALLKTDADLERDLHEILRGYVPRAFGQDPKCPGMFERLSPGTDVYAHVLRVKRSVIRSCASGASYIAQAL